MRIIGGKFKGKRLSAPKNLPIRPTTDFAKEGLFNVLRNKLDIENSAVLDLFAGSGNISFEFASRGAKRVVSIDQNPYCVKYINRTSHSLCFDQINVLRNDVFRYLKKRVEQFDIIFADPPYMLDTINEIPEIIIENKLLTEDGLLILEHGKAWNFSPAPNFAGHYKYGNVHFSFFKNEN